MNKEMQFKESEALELKKSTSELKEAIISIASILNKNQNGALYFGIKNNGQIVGQDVSEGTIREISKSISENIEPKIYPKIKETAINGKKCVYVEFSGNDVPYYAFGRAYIRVGDENRQLSAKELENLILKKNKGRLRWDNGFSEKKLSDINEDEVKNYVFRANRAKRINFEFKGVKATLMKLGLIKENKLLKAAEVLFCDDNPTEVQAAVFAGTDKTTFLDIRSFKGNIFQLINKSESYLKEHINWRAEIKDFKRQEIPEIPVAALREAIINSLCHRDYFRDESNKIAIFKDKIKVYNPGSFPEGLEPEDFIKGDIEPVHRNPLIANLLYYSGDIERWGTGLKRIYKECTLHKIKIKFSKEAGGFSIIFYRPEKVPQKVPEKVPEIRAKAILEHISKDSRITAKKLAEIIGVNEKTVKRDIEKLKAAKKIKRIGPDKGGYWETAK